MYLIIILLNIFFYPLQGSEPITFEKGLECFQTLTNDYPELRKNLKKFGRANLETFEYAEDEFFSPTTLYYVKLIGDMRKHFGNLTKLHICQIGGDEGEMALHLSLAGGFSSYTFIDVESNLGELRKFVAQNHIENVRFVDPNRIKDLPKADLIISHGGFSSLSSQEQERFFKELLESTPNGFLIDQWFSLSHFINRLQSAKKEGLITTDEVLYNNNRVVVWKERFSIFDSDKIKTPIIPFKENGKKKAISYRFSGGRLGDNLIAYLHAKWVSLKMDLPLMYMPFEYSDEFAFSLLEIPKKGNYFKTKIDVRKAEDLAKENGSTLYIVPFFPVCKVDRDSVLHLVPYNFDVDWHDPVFRNIVKFLLTPKRAYRKLILPIDTINVAMHVRRGGGVDGEFPFLTWPMKFPPDSFYLDQLRLLTEIYKDKKLYVYIFTDDQNPSRIVEEYQKQFNHPLVTFDCRRKENGPNLNIFEDLFAMTQFDCLIRSMSHFSIIAGLLKDYEMMIYPTRCNMFDEKKRTINGFEIEYKAKGL